MSIIYFISSAINESYNSNQSKVILNNPCPPCKQYGRPQMCSNRGSSSSSSSRAMGSAPVFVRCQFHQLPLSDAIWLSFWSDIPPHLMMSSRHSLWGLPLLFVPSIFFQTSAPLSSCCCAFCICAQTVLVYCLSASAWYSPLAVFDHINQCSLLSVSILFLVFSCSIFSRKPLFFFQCPSSPPMPHIHIVGYWRHMSVEPSFSSIAIKKWFSICSIEWVSGSSQVWW